jgi:hypothetical protein
MDGSAISTAAGHDRLGRFTRGHSEYAAKRKRVGERLLQLIDHYDADAAQQQLLRVAAELLDEAATTRNLERRAKAANAANRILRNIPRKPEAPPPTLADYERRKREAQP